MDKILVFESILKTFETVKMKEYCADMIQLIPDYIFTMPSSTSGKYHNKTQCQKHGQILHVIMLAKIMNYRLDLDWNKRKFPHPIVRDALRCGAIFHDAIKCGLNGSEHSLFEHPLLSGKWVRETIVNHDIEPELKDYIAKLCESHTGQYNTSKYSQVVLPLPETESQFFIHECDVLASRVDIDLIITTELDVFADSEANGQPSEKPTTVIMTCFDEYLMPYGQYKNQPIKDVMVKDMDYIRWMHSRNITDSTFRMYLDEAVKNKHKKLSNNA